MACFLREALDKRVPVELALEEQKKRQLIRWARPVQDRPSVQCTTGGRQVHDKTKHEQTRSVLFYLFTIFFFPLLFLSSAPLARMLHYD